VLQGLDREQARAARGIRLVVEIERMLDCLQQLVVGRADCSGEAAAILQRCARRELGVFKGTGDL